MAAPSSTAFDPKKAHQIEQTTECWLPFQGTEYRIADTTETPCTRGERTLKTPQQLKHTALEIISKNPITVKT